MLDASSAQVTLFKGSFRTYESIGIYADWQAVAAIGWIVAFCALRGLLVCAPVAHWAGLPLD